MKALIKKGYSYFTNNTETALLSLIAASIPFTINIGNLFIIISTLYALYLLFIKKIISKKSYRDIFFCIPLLFFIISLLSALTSDNLREGIKQLDKQLLVLLLPFILYSLKSFPLKLNQIMLTYTYSVVIATSLLLIMNGIKVLRGAHLEDLFFHNFTMLYDQHPVYFALNIGLALFVLAEYVLKNRVCSTPKNIILISFLVLYIGLIFCASKGVLFILNILFLLYIIMFKKLKRKLLFLSVIIVGAIGVFQIPTIEDRFTEGLTYSSINFTPSHDIKDSKQFTYKEKVNISDLELRLLFLKIGVYHTLWDGKMFFGYGLGDVQDYMNYYYMTYSLAPNWYENFNLHNQYIQIFVTYGLFVFILFIFYLMFSFYSSIKSKNILHLFFLITISFIFLFEVLLTRNKGIVLFFFFNTFFLIKNQKIENSDSWHARNTQ